MKIETRKLSRLEPWMHLATNCLGDNNELKLDFLFLFFILIPNQTLQDIIHCLGVPN